MRIHLICLVAASLGCSLAISAQTPATPATEGSPKGSADVTQPSAPTLADAPMPARAAPSRPVANGSYFYRMGSFCGAGASTSAASTKPTTGCGAGITFMPLPLFLEVGAMSPQANLSYLSGYIGVDGSIPLARSSGMYLPFAMIGYTRFFETGHALDYGLALALPRFRKRNDESRSLRIELRDYCTFANPVQHNVMLRIGWMTELPD